MGSSSHRTSADPGGTAAAPGSDPASLAREPQVCCRCAGESLLLLAEAHFTKVGVAVAAEVVPAVPPESPAFPESRAMHGPKTLDRISGSAHAHS